MRLFKVLASITVLMLLVLTLTPGLKADEVWNRKTTMTFSQPVEIPGGQILPAGTYVFKLLQDSSGNRNIVQISSADETHVYATVLAIANERMHSAENTIVNFEERVAGSPQAIKLWFHPGDSIGHEFVYPKARAVELAKLVNEPVPAMPAEMTPEITAPASSVKDEPVVAFEKTPVTVEEPSGEEVPLSRAFGSGPEVASLPKTASSMPLVGLIGLLSLAAAFTLLIVTKRIG